MARACRSVRVRPAARVGSRSTPTGTPATAGRRRPATGCGSWGIGTAITGTSGRPPGLIGMATGAVRSAVPPSPVPTAAPRHTRRRSASRCRPARHTPGMARTARGRRPGSGASRRRSAGHTPGNGSGVRPRPSSTSRSSSARAGAPDPAAAARVDHDRQREQERRREDDARGREVASTAARRCGGPCPATPTMADASQSTVTTISRTRPATPRIGRPRMSAIVVAMASTRSFTIRGPGPGHAACACGLRLARGGARPGRHRCRAGRGAPPRRRPPPRATSRGAAPPAPRRRRPGRPPIRAVEVRLEDRRVDVAPARDGRRVAQRLGGLRGRPRRRCAGPRASVSPGWSASSARYASTVPAQVRKSFAVTSAPADLAQVVVDVLRPDVADLALVVDVLDQVLARAGPGTAPTTRASRRSRSVDVVQHAALAAEAEPDPFAVHAWRGGPAAS